MGSRLGAVAMQPLGLLLIVLVASTKAQYSSCPEPYGLQLYPHEQYCDKFYKCANGTLYEEVCENGLVFDGHGAAQPLQLQLGRGLRQEGLRRHPHLLPWLSLPVWHLPRWRGLPDHFLQVCCWRSL